MTCECMTQEDAINMSNEQAILILKPFMEAMRDQYGCPISDAYFALEKAINSLREPHWIPCSERLPREEEQDDELGVLVTLGNGYSGLQCDWYHGDHWYDWDGFVVAWMPLPPVYQEEDNK